jgi:valyl-tRNA synthetase
VRDAKGAKMSKTTGNVIDPLETIDQYVFCYTIVLASFLVCDVSLSLIHLLPPACSHSPTPHDMTSNHHPPWFYLLLSYRYGCDALRYSLVTGCTPGQDIPLSMERVESNRNFANKLWNAGKYVFCSTLSIYCENIDMT